MKKALTLITCSLVLFASLELSSQTTVNVKTGIHSADVHADGLSADFINLAPIKRFTTGIDVEQALDKHLSIKSGISYLQKGFQISEGMDLDIGGVSFPIGVKGVTEVHTVNVPVMLQYNYRGLNGITPYISVGPSISYATAGAIKTKASAILDFTLTNTPLNLDSADYNRLGIEGNIMAGAKFPYKSGHFLTELGYNHAVTDFTSDNFIVDAGIRTKGWTFNVGYGISF